MTLKLNGTNSEAAPAYAGDDADTGLQCGTNELKLVTGGSARATVDSSGRLLVGATSGAGKFIVQDSSLPKIQANYADSSHLEFGVGGSGCGFAMTTGHFMTFNHQPYADRGTDNNLTERLRIDSAGRVGIGETSMDGLLVIKGDSNASSQPSIRLKDGTDTREAWISNASGDLVLVNGGNDNTPHCKITMFDGNIISFETANTERARINTTGDFLVGTSNHSPGLGNTNTGAQISSASHIAVSRSGGQPAYFNRNTRTGTIVSLHYNGSQRGHISTDGTVVAYNTSSDYRLKENIVDLDGAITRVKQLQPRRFNFIETPSKTVDGFVAHEAQTVVPEAVTGTHNGLEVWREGEELPEGVSVGDNKLDEDGNTIPDYQGIDQSKLVPLLTKALQEAIAEIETLKTKVAALEASS